MGRRPRGLAVAVAAALGLCGCLAVLAMTRDGAGTTVDSGEYLAVADGLAHGKGFTMPYVSYDEAYPARVQTSMRVPMTQFPPAFPAVVAVGERLSGAGPVSVARWLNAMALGGTAATVALLVYAATGALLWELLAGALVIRPPFVFAHARLLSEPLALLTLALLVAATYRYLSRPRRLTLVAVSLAASVGALTRLPGVVAAVCAAIAIAMWSDGGARQRWVRGVAVIGAALLPLGAWFVRNAVVAGHASDKSLGVHPPGVAAWQQAADRWLAWIGPHHLPGSLVTILVVGLLLAWTTRATWRARHRLFAPGRPSLPRLCLFFAAAYAVFVLAVRTFADDNLSFGSRMFLPVLVLATIGVASAAAGSSSRGRTAVGVLAAATCVWSTAALVGTNIPRFPESRSAGYASRAWRSSPTVSFVAHLDTDVVVVTNAPDPIWLHTRRTPMFIPLERDLYSGGPNRQYEAQLGALRVALRDHRAIVAFFDYPTRGLRHRVPGTMLRDALGLTEMARYRDATVYAVHT